MNMQAMMRQVQSMQKDITKIKNEIDNTEFTATSSFVTVKVNGKKQVLSVNIDNKEITSEDIELLQDIIVVALNDAFNQVDKLTEKKMSKYGNIPGLF